MMITKLKLNYNNTIVFIMMGLSVVISTFSSFYLLRDLTQNNLLISISGALIFGLLVFVTNYNIILRSGHKRRQSKFTSTLPFVILLVLETFIVSFALQIQIFEDQIQRQSEIYVSQLQKQQSEGLLLSNPEYLEAERTLEDLKDSRLNTEILIRDELVGIRSTNENGSTSGYLGDGPRFRFLKSQLDDIIIRIDTVQKRRNEIVSQVNSNIGLRFINYNPTPLEKLGLLQEIDKRGTVEIVSILLSLFIGMINFMPYAMISFLSVKPLKFGSKEFTDIDKKAEQEKNKLRKLNDSNIENSAVLKDGEAINESDFGENSTLNAEVEKLNTIIREKEKLDGLTFQIYFNNMIVAFEREVSRSNEKASVLLGRGIQTSIAGVVFYLLAIIFFQYLFFRNSFQVYHIYGMVSCTLLFIFFQFIGAWFLKQYRYFVDTSTYYMKLKTNIDRYTLALLVTKEFDLNKDANEMLVQKMIDFLVKDVQYPDTYIAKNPDINLAKESLESATNAMKNAIDAMKIGRK